MVTASRILGDEVGSTAPAFLAFLAVHVLAGLTAVITGAIAALARKGSPRHIRAGRWYYRAITVVFATAAVLAAMRWAQDWYLLALGAVAFTAATIGYLHRRRHRPGDTGHIAGMGIAYTAMLTAFYVDNGPHLPLWHRLPVLAFWLLPSVIAASIITRAIIRARNKAQPQAHRHHRQRSLAGRGRAARLAEQEQAGGCGESGADDRDRRDAGAGGTEQGAGGEGAQGAARGEDGLGEAEQRAQLAGVDELVGIDALQRVDRADRGAREQAQHQHRPERAACEQQQRGGGGEGVGEDQGGAGAELAGQGGERQPSG